MLINAGIMMGNKEIQEQRMKTYFIEATKEILKGEGLKNISVRNIAERAGYSYATLYNYFKDVRDLIFECVIDFQEECQAFVVSETEKTKPGIEKLKSISKAYVKYFIQYPGTFELFFLEKTNDVASKQPTLKLISNFLDRLSNNDWEYCINTKVLSAEDAEVKKNTLNFMLVGMLLFYINRRQPETYKEFSDELENQINSILTVK